MGEIVKLEKNLEFDSSGNTHEEADIIALSEELLLSTRRDIEEKRTISMPLAEMATLGAGVASLLPAFRTVTQTTTFNTEGMYRLANKSAGDVLKTAKDGTEWASFKTAEGKSKMVKLKEAGGITAESKAVMPINPTTMMMAVALYSIEKQLGQVNESIDKIYAALEREKESEISADLKILQNIIKKYKHNWNDKLFISTYHQMVADIQRTALKHIESYECAVSELLKPKKGLLSKQKVDSLMAELQKNFSYYRLSVYTFSMASFMEIMLSENYAEPNVLEVKKTVETQGLNYRSLYTQCSMMLEKLVDKSIEQNLLQGIGFVGKKAGEFIGSIPLVKEGPVDELLQEGGEKLDKSAEKMIDDALAAFAEMSNPRISVFTEKMDDLIQIYNHTEVICFDQERLYLVGE